MNGRKRHILVDTAGLLVRVLVTAANVQDRDGGCRVAALAMEEGVATRVRHVWADAAYRGRFADTVRDQYGWTIEVVQRTDGEPGFEVLPRRWVVERTFGWFGRFRRLSKDYEFYTGVAEAFIYAATIHLLLRRLCR